MKLRLITPNQIPYGGKFQTVDRLTNLPISGSTFKLLMDDLRAKRRANGFGEAGLEIEEEVQQWLCEDLIAQHGDAHQECEVCDANRPRIRNLGLSDIVSGTKVLLSVALEGGKALIGLGESPLVEQDEANRRAEICARCKFNVTFAKPCTGICAELAVVVNAVKAGRSTPYDNDLHSCSVCGCFAAAHVWPRLDLLAKGISEEQKKQFAAVPNCWKQIP